MAPLFSQLHQDHINYSRLLNLLEANFQLLSAGENADYLIMQDILKYMINYPDVYHHPAEERLFEELGQIDENDAVSIDRLSTEHSLIAETGNQLDEQLKDAASGNIVSRDQILELGKRYIDAYREHINLEEREIFPLLESRINSQAQDRIQRQLEEVSDPVFSGAVDDEYRRLFKSITEQSPDT